MKVINNFDFECKKHCGSKGATLTIYDHNKFELKCKNHCLKDYSSYKCCFLCDDDRCWGGIPNLLVEFATILNYIKTHK